MSTGRNEITWPQAPRSWPRCAACFGSSHHLCVYFLLWASPPRTKRYRHRIHSSSTCTSLLCANHQSRKVTRTATTSYHFYGTTSPLPAMMYFMSTAVLKDGHCYSPHFLVGKTEARKDEAAHQCPQLLILGGRTKV